MALKPQALKRAAARSVGDHLDRAWMENELVIVSVNEFNPAAITSYGPQAQVDCDLLIASGPHEGERDEHWMTWGNLAAQIGANSIGETVVLRVIQGGPPDRRFWGVDTDISDAEFSHAQQVLLEVAGVKRPAAASSNGKGRRINSESPPF